MVFVLSKNLPAIILTLIKLGLLGESLSMISLSKKNNTVNTRGCLIALCIIILFSMIYPANEVLGYAPNSVIKFDQISIEHGLSENVVMALAQDSTGFIWIGTQDGLNRYDGNAVKVFRNDPDNPESISNSYISAIFADPKGTLWVGTAGGLNRFDPKTEKFTRFLNDERDQYSISSDNITIIYQDRSGSIWVGTADGGLNKFDNEKGNFIRYKYLKNTPNSISHNNIRTIFEDRSGVLWVGTIGGGLNKLDKKTGKFFHYKPEPNRSHSISHKNITSVFEDKNSRLWIGTDGGGLNHFDRKTDRFIHYKFNAKDKTSISHNAITSIIEDKAGILWVGTNGGGLNAFDRKRERFARYTHDSGDAQSLSTNNTTAILEDDSGILWFGTEIGISRIDYFKLKFTHYKQNSAKPNGLKGKSITAIGQDQSGTLWVGTANGGLNKFNKKDHTFIHYNNDPQNIKSIGGGTIYSILEDRSNRIWIGTQNGGLNLYDPKTNSFIRYMHNPEDENSLSNDFVWPIYEDAKGVLWIGTWGGGLNKFDPEKGLFSHYKSDPDNANSLSNDQLSSILGDSTGKLWVGTFQGLNYFDPELEIFSHYVNDPKNPNSLSNNAAISICEDNTGTIWVGTLGGLNRLDRKTNSFTHYGKKEGLPNEVITSILEDNQGMLWISTFNGISKFNPINETFKNYNVEDGLQSKRFKANAHLKSRDGQLFFGGINGFNAFYPEKIKDNTYIPPIVLTDFQLFNHSLKPNKNGVLKESINGTQKINLSYKDSVFSFEFASLHFSAPKSIKYAYKLEGFDKNWLYTDATKRFATYTNIHGGDYIFRVKGTNSDGVWNEKSTDIKIIVEPPFWNKDWFYMLLTASVFVLAGLITMYFLKLKYEIKERKRAEKEVVKNEIRYKSLLENQTELVCRFKADGTFTYVNQVYCNFFKKPRTELIGKKWQPLPVDDDLLIIEEKLSKLSPSNQTVFIENRVKSGTGKIHWVQFINKGFFDGSGNLQEIQSVGRDITKQKQVEQDLQKSLSRDQAMLSAIPDSMFRMNRDGMFLNYKADINDLYVPSESSIIGKRNRDITPPEFADFIDQKIFDTLEAGCLQTFEYQLPIPNSGIQEYEARMIPSGIDEVTAIVRNITERKQAEKDVRQLNQFRESIVENANIWLNMLDEKGNVVIWNKAAESISGYSKEEVVGHSKIWEWAYPDKTYRDKITAKATAIIIEYEVLEDFETTIQRKDGKERIISWNSRNLLNDQGKPIGSIALGRDITARKMAQKEKMDAQKVAAENKQMALVGKIAGKMAHDFNNVLSIILGNAELSLIDCKDPEVKKSLELIFEQTLRGKNLTKNLVAFAKDQEPKQEFFPIDEKVELVLNLLKKDLEGINVARKYSRGVPELLADPGMVEHALVNLIQNSIHATSLIPRPEITIRTYTDNEHIITEIEDNGCGIPQDAIGKIYEPSFTLKGSKDVTGAYESKIKGTGYGMSNVKKYVDQHKGMISIHSEPNKGTKVVISLPVMKKELSEEEVIEIKKENIHYEKYVLLVEDEQSISDVQYQVLTHEPCNHKVDIANSGHVAMDLLDRNNYDLISLDYILPGKINGMDVYHYIREKNNFIPILFISGNIEFLESIKQLKQQDPNIAHLSKPCLNKDYVKWINRLLDRVPIT